MTDIAEAETLVAWIASAGEHVFDDAPPGWRPITVGDDLGWHAHIGWQAPGGAVYDVYPHGAAPGTPLVTLPGLRAVMGPEPEMRVATAAETVDVFAREDHHV